MRPEVRVDLDDFERRYVAEVDPWGFESRHYELRKYDVTVASLPRVRYARCFEPGCSIGVLTDRLATIADEVVAMDASPSAIERARRRLRGAPGVDVSVGSIPESWPDGVFDLVVLSELGYYWDEQGLEGIAALAAASTVPYGHIVAVHWLGSSPDHLLSGEHVHAILDAALGPSVVHHRDAEFVLDVYEMTA